MLRMMSALRGTWIPSAFSTDRTRQRVHRRAHPADAFVNAQASRGSRPCRITSIPRHIVPEEIAFSTVLPPLSIASILRCPSIRVIGSTTTRLVVAMAAPYSSFAFLRALAHQERTEMRRNAHRRYRRQRLPD